MPKYLWLQRARLKRPEMSIYYPVPLLKPRTILSASFSRGGMRWCTAFLLVCTIFVGLIAWGISLPVVLSSASTASPTAMVVGLVALPSLSAPAAHAKTPTPIFKPVLPPPLPALPQPLLPLPPIAPPHHPHILKNTSTKQNPDPVRYANAPSTSPPAPPTMAPVKSQPSLSVANSPCISAPNWESLVLKKLQSLKRYPAAAQSAGEQGIATVRFTMDRQGYVLSTSLVKSTGYVDLDAESIALIHQASPLPAPPHSLAGDIITLTVPVVFFLNQDFLQRKSN